MNDAMTAASVIRQIVGDDLMTQICDALGGENVYIPRRVPDPYRAETMVHEFTRVLDTESSVMSAYQTVASAHHVSPRTVQRVVLGN